MEALKPVVVAMLLYVAASRLANGDESCEPSGSLPGSGDHSCDECCKADTNYPIYECSPPVSQSTPAILTVNDFSAGGDGGGPAECDGRYHDNGDRIAALSTGWYAGGSRCGKLIAISANGRTTVARVVDECDSTRGCDEEHSYQPPCGNNIVDGSDSVWEALGVAPGEMEISWADLN